MTYFAFQSAWFESSDFASSVTASDAYFVILSNI